MGLHWVALGWEVQGRVESRQEDKGALGDLSSHQPWPFILLLITINITITITITISITWWPIIAPALALYTSAHYRDNTDEDARIS